MALFGGGYASHLAHLPLIQVPLESGIRVRWGRSLDEMFEYAAFWRQLTDEDITTLQNGRPLDKRGSHSPIVLECEIDGKQLKFAGHIERVAEDIGYGGKVRGERLFYLLFHALAPGEREQLVPFCQCKNCHPFLSSRADVQCLKDPDPSLWAILEARKAQRDAQKRWCMVL